VHPSSFEIFLGDEETPESVIRMMMEQCGYGMAMGGYAHVPEYMDGYPVSPYAGLVRERTEDAGQGLYERRGVDNCWDRSVKRYVDSFTYYSVLMSLIVFIIIRESLMGLFILAS